MPEAALIAVLTSNGLRVVDVLQRGRNARTGARESQVSVILCAKPGAGEPVADRSPAPIVDERRVRAAVQREFARLAIFPGRGSAWSVGAAAACALGYPRAALGSLPSSAVESFCGVAYPLAALAPRPGERIVDVGAGSGVDCLLAARLVADGGLVVGVDLSAEMLRKAGKAAKQARVRNVRFEAGIAEHLALPSESADAVLCNGVVNLFVVDKGRALLEARRVLKPGGRLVLADVVVDQVAPREERSLPERWATHLVGPVPEPELLDLLARAGFANPSVVARGELRADDGSHTPVPLTGARTVLIRASR